MFGLWGRGIKASENFYRNLFAIATFVAFGVAFFTNNIYALFATLAFGALSRTAVKKGWKNPEFVRRTSFLVRKPQDEPSDGEDEA